MIAIYKVVVQERVNLSNNNKKKKRTQTRYLSNDDRRNNIKIIFLSLVSIRQKQKSRNLQNSFRIYLQVNLRKKQITR